MVINAYIEVSQELTDEELANLENYVDGSDPDELRLINGLLFEQRDKIIREFQETDKPLFAKLYIIGRNGELVLDSILAKCNNLHNGKKLIHTSPVQNYSLGNLAWLDPDIYIIDGLQDVIDVIGSNFKIRLCLTKDGLLRSKIYARVNGESIKIVLPIIRKRVKRAIL